MLNKQPRVILELSVPCNYDGVTIRFQNCLSMPNFCRQNQCASVSKIRSVLLAYALP